MIRAQRHHRRAKPRKESTLTSEASPEERLRALGYEFPETSPPTTAVLPGVITGSLLYLSGSIPDRGGKTWRGRVGDVFTTEEGAMAARECAINQLFAAKAVLGDLGRIKRVVKVLGMVNCVPGFTETPIVMHGFSNFLVEILGDAGRHARSAVGLQALPHDVPIEVETIFEIEPEST
jgi:enamine deaminase RidA (YjgF/YER057c/UK114 family)